MNTLRHCFFCVAILCAITAFGEGDTRWNQWRGPQRDGGAALTPVWPDSLEDSHLNQSWMIELGPSYSGPVVDEKRVYTTESRDNELEVVHAFDRRTGEKVWQAEWPGSMQVPFFAAANGSWIRSTPALDGDRLYVAGMRDVLVCLNTIDGSELWRFDFCKQLDSPLPAFGFVASPLVDGEHVYVQAGGGVVKLNKMTGNIAWQTSNDGGGMQGSAFSSPVIATIAGTRQLVVQTRLALKGIDLENGSELWSQSIEAFRGMNILTPTVVGDSLFTSAHSGSTQRWQVAKEGKTWELSQQWKISAQGYMSSPVIIDGHAYLHLRNQRFSCINLATGIEQWRTRPFGKYWSLAFQGDKILALDERGTLRLIAADPSEFRVLSEREISRDQAWAHVAVDDGQVFVRELGALTAYEWK